MPLKNVVFILYLTVFASQIFVTESQYFGKTCGENEVFSNCGSMCPSTCDNMYPRCHNKCMRGCFCKPGYVLHLGRCVSPSLCPVPTCLGINEEYKECGTMCPQTCQNQKSNCVPLCQRGCFCKDGYVRNDKGVCISPENCPNLIDNESVCQENEVYSLCKTNCTADCDHPKVKCRNETCEAGCVCKDGYLRDPAGRCVLQAHCPKCGAREIFTPCGTACPPTCRNPDPKCNNMTCVSGCFCKIEFLRNDEGRCVLPSTCPSNSRENVIYQANYGQVLNDITTKSSSTNTVYVSTPGFIPNPVNRNIGRSDKNNKKKPNAKDTHKITVDVPKVVPKYNIDNNIPESLVEKLTKLLDIIAEKDTTEPSDKDLCVTKLNRIILEFSDI